MALLNNDPELCKKSSWEENCLREIGLKIKLIQKYKEMEPFNLKIIYIVVGISITVSVIFFLIKKQKFRKTK